MRAITIVRFDSSETEACKRVLDSITVAYPDYHAPAAGTRPDFQFLRAATATAKRGSDLGWQLLDMAAVVFQRQLDLCREQSDVEYWKRTLLNDGEATVPTGGTALVADPVAMCDVLAETRTAQAQDAERALRLVLTARARTSPPPVDEED